MSHKAGCKFIASLALMLALLTGWPASAEQQEDPTVGMRDMTTEELYRIYANKTWLWSDGAAIFKVKKREFNAYTEQNDSKAYAEGNWFPTWHGKLCFKARWIASDYDVEKLSCFGHRTDNQSTSRDSFRSLPVLHTRASCG